MRKSGLLTAKDFPDLTISELYDVLTECQSPGYYQLAVEELQRRYMLEVAARVKELNDPVTELKDSSLRIENLTVTLKWLTIVLIVLTTAQLLFFLWDTFFRHH